MGRIRLRDPILPLAAAACLILALVAGGRYPFYGFYLLSTLTALSYLWARSLATCLRFSYNCDRLRLTSADSAVVELRLSNEGFLPAPWVEFNDPLLARWIRLPRPGEIALDERAPFAGLREDARPGSRPTLPRTFALLPHSLFWLAPLGSRIVHFRVKRLQRGHYRLGPMEMQSRDPLGIFAVRRRVESRSTVTVYPAITPIAGFAVPAGQSFGLLRTREKAREDLSSLAQVRPFRPGDNPKLVHWKVTARQGSLHVRDYERTTTVQLIIFLDLFREAERSGADGYSTTDLAAEVAASIAFYAWGQGYESGLVGYGGQRVWIPPRKGTARFHHLMEALARIRADGHVPLEQVLRRESQYLVPRATVVAVTPAIGGVLTETLARLHRKGFSLIVIRIRGETFSAEAAPQRERWQAPLTALGARAYEVGRGDNLGKVLGAREYGLDRRRAGRAVALDRRAR